MIIPGNPPVPRMKPGMTEEEWQDEIADYCDYWEGRDDDDD